MTVLYTLTCNACGAETEPPSEPLEGVDNDGDGPFLPALWAEVVVVMHSPDPEHNAQVAELAKQKKAAQRRAREAAATSSPPLDVNLIEPQMVAAAEVEYAVTAPPYLTRTWQNHFCPNCARERLAAIGVQL